MRSRPFRCFPVVTAAISALALLGSALPAAAAGDAPGDAFSGRDVSFPQCGGPFPRGSNAPFGVLGTNGGMSFTRNPCLVDELAWAKRLAGPPAFYANTGNPGPRRAKHWPAGQTTPEVCTWTDLNSIGCSYDYGWNAAWDSFTAATDAAQQLHHVDRENARHRAANVDWWLDVETMNSWQSLDTTATGTSDLRDIETLAGAVDALRTAGVVSVGVYSTSFQWNLITGGTAATQGRLAGVPVWLAGYSSHAGAVEGCADRGFTGGPVRMTQYLGGDGFDADVVCADVDAE